MKKTAVLAAAIVFLMAWQPAWLTTQAQEKEAIKVKTTISSEASPLKADSSAVPQEGPFAHDSTLPYHMPPFDKVKEADYRPAFEAGMAEQRKEADAIAHNPAPPTFENTMEYLAAALLDQAWHQLSFEKRASLRRKSQHCSISWQKPKPRSFKRSKDSRGA